MNISSVAKPNVWKILIKIDGYILKSLSWISWSVTLLNARNWKLLKNNPVAKVKEKDLFVILNGPSLKLQDLSVLKGRDIVFVNRGFQHHEYINLSPKYHAFVDSKMLTGEWPIEWIDEILAINSDIVFIMPISWSSHHLIKPYIEKSVKIYWLNTKFKFYSLGVAGSCFEFGINECFQNIYFTGFDANGIGYELVGSSSHFYGENKENKAKTTLDYAQDLYMHSRHFLSLNDFVKYARNKNVNMINMTEGGVLDMFSRVDLNVNSKVNI